MFPLRILRRDRVRVTDRQMSEAREDRPVVLIVEDEPDLADLYATWLRDEYTSRVTYGGTEALEALDDDVSVVLLDRRMPEMSGDAVLEAIRDRGIDCRVAMVTAVEPDFDIVAMGFDDYLVKPVSKDALRGTVESLHLRSTYDEGVQHLFSLASKKALLESEKSRTALADNEEYAELAEELDDLRAELDETVQELGQQDDFVGVYRDLERDVAEGSDAPVLTGEESDVDTDDAA
jgi:two-component system response regulator AdeR